MFTFWVGIAGIVGSIGSIGGIGYLFWKRKQEKVQTLSEENVYEEREEEVLQKPEQEIGTTVLLQKTECQEPI
mgnify:CR=1 FL=1